MCGLLRVQASALYDPACAFHIGFHGFGKLCRRAADGFSAGIEDFLLDVRLLNVSYDMLIESVYNDSGRFCRREDARKRHQFKSG